MRTSDILGYNFAVFVKKGEVSGFVATCPGVGGVYEEGATAKEAVENAAEAACAIFDARVRTGTMLTEDGPYLKVMRRPERKAKPVPVYRDKSVYSGTCILPDHSSLTAAAIS